MPTYIILSLLYVPVALAVGSLLGKLIKRRSQELRRPRFHQF